MSERRDTRLRFEQWARNPACSANTISAVHGISMAEVAKSENITPTMGQSPFAIARGQTFERSLFRDNAKTLRKALEDADVLPSKGSGFADFRMRIQGGKMRDLDAARAGTTVLLKQIAEAVTTGKTKKQPSIVAAATLLIPAGVMLPEALLVVDVIALTYDKASATITVGEVKTYPDRGGHTDGGELASARAQAGVYVHAFDLVLKELGLAGAIKVAEKGFLVLSRPGFNQPSVRPDEDLKYQARRAARGFAMLERAAQEIVPAKLPDPLSAVRGAPTDYCEACVSFCDRAPICFGKAMKDGNGVVLGEDVRRFLGPVSLPRMEALLDGAKPQNVAEQDLLHRLIAGGGAV